MSTGRVDRFFVWSESRNPAVGMLVWMVVSCLAVAAWSTGLFTLHWLDGFSTGACYFMSILFIALPLCLTALGCVVMGAGMLVAATGITLLTLLSTKKHQ